MRANTIALTEGLELHFVLGTQHYNLNLELDITSRLSRLDTLLGVVPFTCIIEYY